MNTNRYIQKDETLDGEDADEYARELMRLDVTNDYQELVISTYLNKFK
tara:strand:- start:953 stop:1096 length:144 start_codon:yes stop_codon:yes gene_type:complete